ncbi:MAG: tetratricopeptide repeat protein [Thermoanaerobaculia bacterium]
MPLLPGAGECPHPISTSNREAQKYFDQGLCFVYAFNHEDAIRSFERAAELDPRSPMPPWGIALANGPNINMDVDADHEKAAFAALQKAISLSANGSEIERAYVSALSKRYSGDPKADWKKLSTDYRLAMKDLSTRYPDDLDAATLYAESIMDLNPWAFWTKDGKPARPDSEEMVAVLESVLKRAPNHLGANHYYIHALEASDHPERAMASALRMENLAPDDGHLVHMPAHIYARTGAYGDGSRVNEDAADVDRAYMRRAGGQTFYALAYYSHNLHFLSFCRSMEGRYSDARKAADLLVEHVKPAIEGIPMLEMFLPVPMEVDLRFHRWKEILTAPEPPEKQVVSRTFRHFARSCAFAAAGDARRAEEEAAAFEKLRSGLSADAMLPLINPASSILEVASHVAKAEIAAAKGKTGESADESITEWKKAVAAQDALNYDEPPDWYSPVRESLGGALLRAGRPADAERVFREDLEINPRNGRSLFGLWKSLEAQKRDGDAAWVKAQFDEAWKNADAPLTVGDL